jgi:hypothetical protein
LGEVDSPMLLHGIALWRELSGDRKFPPRSAMTVRVLRGVLRNITLLRVIDGGRDYEYRVVGDAYVMAHGISFQGKRWSEIESLSPRHYATIKPIYDSVVLTGEPVATRGWIERGAHANEHVYCEYVYLPLGTEEAGVDHIMALAVYVTRGPSTGMSYWSEYRAP